MVKTFCRKATSNKSTIHEGWLDLFKIELDD